MGGFRRFIRIVWTLVAMVALFVAIAVIYPIPQVSPVIANTLMNNEYALLAEVIILGVVLFGVLCFFIHGLFARSKKHEVVVKNDLGELIIQDKAVKSVAEETAHQFSSVVDEDVKVKMSNSPEKTRISVKAYTRDANDLTGLSKRIQEAVWKKVDLTLGVHAEKVDVDMEQEDYERTQQESASRQNRNSNRPRVK
ncbi:MAG: alkaline shock response membrane anchor protein AmaP [Aerococcus sp.]|nr:alkaline shock response membrane anchor protein AmaP [Aerococcus sp.]